MVALGTMARVMVEIVMYSDIALVLKEDETVMLCSVFPPVVLTEMIMMMMVVVMYDISPPVVRVKVSAVGRGASLTRWISP